MGSTLRYFRAIVSKMSVRFGTTDEMPTPVRRAGDMSASTQKLLIVNHVSSAVLVPELVTRQSAISRSPLYTPITVCVFPMSMASSIVGADTERLSEEEGEANVTPEVLLHHLQILFARSHLSVTPYSRPSSIPSRRRR